MGTRLFGLKIDEVPYLKIAYDHGLGKGDLNKIKVIGKDLGAYKEKYG